MTRRRIASRRWLVPLGLMLLLAGLVVSAPVARAANTLHVTSCADDGGAATLRGMIGTAGDGDTIVFDQDCTIVLLLGPLSQTQNHLTIDGVGHTVIVDGNNSAQVFAQNNGTLTENLSNLTIRNGNAKNNFDGAGISNSGTMTVTNALITQNIASGDGGGIVNFGTLTVINSTITGNTAVDNQNNVGGGGIYNNHNLTVTNCTITGNRSGRLHFQGGEGGGIASDPHGGRVLTMTNTIVAGNSTFATFPNSTIPVAPDVEGHVNQSGYNLIGVADAAGGPWIASDLTGTIANPLNPVLGSLGSYGGPTQTTPLLPSSPAIAGGTTGAGIPTTDQRGVARTGHTDIGAFQSQGFSLAKTGGDNQSQQTSVLFPIPLTLTVTANAAGAPYNEPVQGGVLTVTPPSSGASATVNSNLVVPANGQESIALTANGTAGGPYTVTVGASGAPTISFSLTNVVAPVNSTYTVGTTADHIGGLTNATTCRTAGNTTCTLRDALAYATSSTDTVIFKSGIGPASTVVGANGPLVVGANMTITGPGASILAIDGGCTGCDPGGTPSGGVTVFVVNSGVTASVSGLTIQHGNASVTDSGHLYGGGIFNNEGTLTLTSVTIRRNNAGNGAGLYTNGGGVVVQASTISENRGAGIFNNGGTTTLTNSTVSGNTGGDGPGIYNNSTLTVANSTISGNTGGGFGGGIFNYFSGTLTVRNSTISGNSAVGGGGIFNFNSMTVMKSTVSGNSAQGNGGGGIGNASTLTVTNSTITGNSSDGPGGGINSYGVMTVTNSTITGNAVNADLGGGIANNPNNTVTTTNTIVARNTASRGAPNLSGPIATGGHNLFGTTNGATITLGPGDLLTANPLLGSLLNNGGPTQTLALLPGSPAIDAGDDAVCAQTGAGKVNNVDQRGTARPFGAHCDIGAFEYQQVNTLPAPQPPGPAGGPANPLPAVRPAGSSGGAAPNPLPAPRP